MSSCCCGCGGCCCWCSNKFALICARSFLSFCSSISRVALSVPSCKESGTKKRIKKSKNLLAPNRYGSTLHRVT